MDDNNYEEYFRRIRAAESGGNKYAKNPFKGQTASGIYQFTKGTFEGLGYDWKDRFDNNIQTQAAVKFTKQNEDYLKKRLGIKPNYADLYGAHFLGAAGYAKLYRTSNNLPISSVMSQNEIDVNPSYTKNKDGSLKTVGEVKAILAKKTGVASTAQPEEEQETSTYKPYVSYLQENAGTIETAGKYSEPKEVTEAKKEIYQAQQEENFLEALSNLQQQPQQEAPQQEQSYLENPELFQLAQVPQIQYEQDGGIIKDNNGYWNPNNWGKTVEISSPNITMKGVGQPLVGYAPETGETKIMLPGEDYFFNGANRVIESPIYQTGGKHSTDFLQNIKSIKGQMIPASPFIVNAKTSTESPEIIDITKVKDVKAIQQKLVEAGFNLDPEGKYKNRGVDGILGKTTKNVIEKYNNYVRSNTPIDIKEYATPGEVVNTYNPIELNSVAIRPESRRVKKQLDLIKQNNYENNGDSFAIINKRANTIHYYDKNYNLISTEDIITGSDNSDVDYSISMRDWIEQNPGKTHDDYFDYLKKNNTKTTPAGHFTIASLKENVNKNQKGWTGQLIDYAKDLMQGQSLGTHSRDIEASRTKDYGEKGKLFTLKSDEGVYSSKAIHGTNNPVRIDAFNQGDAAKRDLSNGCINVNGQSKCFDLLKRNSSIYILPENSEDLVTVKNKSIRNGDVIQRSKSKVYNTLRDLGVKPNKDTVDFISAVHGKESSFGTAKRVGIEDMLPGFDSDGQFQINPKTFKDYLPKDYDGTFEKQVEAVYNFYNKNKDTPEKLYNMYNTGSKRKKSDFIEEFSKIYKHVSDNY